MNTDPRRNRARILYAEGMSKREIARTLGVRWDSLAAWLADMPPPTERKKKQLTPPPFAEGFRWFSARWR